MSGRLTLRRGVVASVDRGGAFSELTVDVGGADRRALADTALVGAVEAGDEVIVNTAAVDLGLGSGGFDLVHVNLTRGLAGAGPDGTHVMKLNYSSLQHAVEPIEERAGPLATPLAMPVGVISLHGQLACVAWALAELRSGTRVGYVQTGGGALPGGLSRVVAELLERGLLTGHITASPAYGGPAEAITTAGAIHAAASVLRWDAAIVGPGPGILGSSTALGHGGLIALDSAHAALALGCPTLIVPRMSSGDPRERHRGLSHHSATVLDLLLAPVHVGWPSGEEGADTLTGKHMTRVSEPDLDGYLASGLPARTMGRAAAEDPLFFGSALAGGAALGALIDGV
ncbi:MAG: DUF3866 family protein [Thermoleophilaceae bacterium]|nr:DUF3866 family protein [Thermoleophilaceae bacterium]